MKKFSGIFLAVLLIFTAVSCSFFMEEKNNNSGSLVSFSLAGKASKAEEDNGIEEYITYGESTVKYGTWSDLKWDIWYYVTDTDAVLFTTPSEIHNLISNLDSGWKKYNNKPFIVEKGSHVWAYCENTSNTDVSPVVSYMFKGIADKEVEKTKTIIVIEPKIDEAVAFENNTRGSLKIKKLVYKMSKDQFESLASPTDLKKIKVTIKVGDKTYSTETDITNTDYEYGYAEFDPIEIKDIKVSEGGTTPSDIVVEFIGLKEDGKVSSECTPSNLFDMSSPTDSAVEVYILNNLETELESLVVENKTIGVATVYINTTTTDMFPHAYYHYDMPASDALYFQAKGDSITLQLDYVFDVDGYHTGSTPFALLEYTLDGENWIDYSWSDERERLDRLEKPSNKYVFGYQGTSIQLNEGDRVFFRAKSTNTNFSSNDKLDSNAHDFYNFAVTGTGTLEVNGSILYLLDKNGKPEFLSNSCFSRLFAYCGNLTKAPELSFTSLKPYCYEGMFYYCTALTKAPELPAEILVEGCYANMFAGCVSLEEAPKLPATTLAESCYFSMFGTCKALTEAPELPLTSLAKSCYQAMFSGCQSLTTAPELPATTLASNCYNSMFRSCNNLVDIPELPATTLAEGCYASMFESCTSLTDAPKLPVTTLANSCYHNMFYNCTSLRTAPALPATTLASDCYNGMFASCSALTYAPELPAQVLPSNCYKNMFNLCTSLENAPVISGTVLGSESCYCMFYKCKKLNNVKVKFTSWQDSGYNNPTGNWLEDVSSSGTFHCPEGLTTETRGKSYIPEGWEIAHN